MAENPFLGVRLPPDIHQALLDRAAAMGKTRSEIAIAALSAYLDLPTDNGDLTDIQQQLSDVKQRLSVVEQTLSDVKQGRAIDSVQPTQTARSIPAATGDYADFEDEPDEVLTDFLETQPPQNAPGEAIVTATDESAAALSDDGFTLEQICSQFKISFKNLSRNAKAKGQSNLNYLRDQTGKNWVQRGKRYFLLEAIAPPERE